MNWISVQDRFPDIPKDGKDKTYIIYSIYNGVTTAEFRYFYSPAYWEYRNKHKEYNDNLIVKYFSYGHIYAQGVTHWMEMPEAPEGSTKIPESTYIMD